MAIGVLLLEGIGDTIRISLTDRPEEEVRAAKAVLESLELRSFGPRVISCPTCGRCEVDLVRIIRDLEPGLMRSKSGLLRRTPKLAIMGCVVNGPGEAREADIGIAFGRKEGLLFRNGKPVKKISLKDCKAELLKELKRYAGCGK